MRAVCPVVLFVFVAACGGKIVTDPVPTSASERAPGSDRSETPPNVDGHEPITVTPSSRSSFDACTTLCERDARCDTTIPALPERPGESSGDCVWRCKARLVGACGIDEWLLCYAAHIEPAACTPLPDECRPAFCAWAACASQPVSSCE